jgi:hypothetical protein
MRLPAASLTARALALALLGPIGAFGLSGTTQGQTAANASPAGAARDLEGSWRGGGLVTFASGAKEQARCRASYQRASKNSYRLQASCATASGRADQTATLHRVADNRYRGNFRNADYDISGTIFVVVRGNIQNVRLTSSSGWATFQLSR